MINEGNFYIAGRFLSLTWPFCLLNQFFCLCQMVFIKVLFSSTTSKTSQLDRWFSVSIILCSPPHHQQIAQSHQQSSEFHSIFYTFQGLVNFTLCGLQMTVSNRCDFLLIVMA